MGPLIANVSHRDTSIPLNHKPGHLERRENRICNPHQGRFGMASDRPGRLDQSNGRRCLVTFGAGRN